MQHVLDARQNDQPPSAPYQLAHGAAGEDFIQSATEVATPSNAASPDVGGMQQAVEETKSVVNSLYQGLEAAGPESALDAAGQRIIQDSVSDGPNGLTHASVKDVSATLRRLAPSLETLQNQLSGSIRNMGERLAALESMSFSHVPVEEMQDRFENLDGRLLELEVWRDEHDKIHAASDGERSSVNAASQQRHTGAGLSFTSNSSQGIASAAHSVSSSALIAAAMDRAETHSRFNAIEERLDELEDRALPSPVRPWEVEVTLLPWGKELGGIWYSPDDLALHRSQKRTQDSDEWTQAAKPSSFTRSMPALNPFGNPWDQQAIQDWADQTDEWLSPKACGIKSVVYNRLLSRGMVRNIQLHNSSARDVQAAIVSAFGAVLETITGPDAETAVNLLDDGISASFLGFDAPFIPLRKVRGSSRLLFLTPAEMATPALWTAEFLASGVLMRASGGQKRLFITHRPAYIQHHALEEGGWTWQSLRELPRVRATPEPSNGSQVPEADAKEACWRYHQDLDVSQGDSSHALPISGPASSSQSNRSAKVDRSTRQAAGRAPVTPVSGTVPSRRHRTSSAPSFDILHPSSDHHTKRRIASFELGNPCPKFVTSSPQRSADPYYHVSKRPRLYGFARFPQPTEADGGANEGPAGQLRRTTAAEGAPFPLASAGAEHTAHATAQIRRGITPIAYPTPHSGTVFGRNDFGGGDTEADSDEEVVNPASGPVEDDVWRGFQEDLEADMDAFESEDGQQDLGVEVREDSAHKEAASGLDSDFDMSDDS